MTPEGPRRKLVLRPSTLGKRGQSVSEACAAKTYRPRTPKSTPLYRLVETFCEEVKRCWEERFERLYGR